MDKFEYKGKAEIKHLNVRKEGPDDEKALAVDVKLSFVASAELIDFFHDGLRSVLFTDIGAVKNCYLESLKFSNKIKNCELTILDQHYNGVDVSKFVLTPKDTNQVTITFSVSISPSGTEVAQLAEYVMDEVDIHILPLPQLDFGTAQEAPAHVVNSDGPDALYDEAVKLVVQTRRASISLVQRHLRIGYNRAARLMEQMELGRVVSPMKSNGNRDVLKAAA